MGVFSEMNATSVPSAFQDDTGNPVVFEQAMPAGFQSQISAPLVSAPNSDASQGTSKKQLQQAPTQKETQESAAVQPVSQLEKKEEGEKDKADDKSEDEKRRAHEEAEAKRKAEWEAKQAAKKAAEKEQLDRLAVMSDDEAASAAMQRIGADTEKLTRRNMKECISEHIQTMCLEDPDFARKVMHPRKSMIHCIWYINRKALEFVQEEMKTNGFKPENQGIYGSDVPDDLCYAWAVEYFNDPNAEEDKDKDAEYVPKPYYGSSKASSSKKKETSKKKESPKPKEQQPTKKKAADSGQMTLGDLVMLKESA